VVDGEVAGETGHPGGGLGLAVHDDEVPAAPGAELDQAADALGLHPPPRLGQVAQAGQLPVGEPAALEQLEGVRDTGDGRDARSACLHPEAVVDDGVAGQEHARTDREVGVEHGQAVAVRQRQGQRGAVVGADVGFGPDPAEPVAAPGRVELEDAVD